MVKLNSEYLNNCKKDNEGYYCEFENIRYTKVDTLKEGKYHYTIHFYPIEDTKDSEGVLNGYKDALFFKAVIYNEDLREYYVTPYLCDNFNTAFMIDEGVLFQFRIFKDGSPLFIMQKKYHISVEGKDILIKDKLNI